MGSVNRGRPVSQHRDVGGPDAAEQGEELRAPGGTVDVTAMATGAAGGDGGAEETAFCKKRKIGLYSNSKFQ